MGPSKRYPPPLLAVCEADSHSRRHSPTPDHVEVLILSPTDIPIPVPQAGLPDPDSLNRMGRAHASFRPTNGYSRAEERALDFLTSQLVPELTTKGIIADTLNSYARRWSGFVRIPEDTDGEPDSPRSVKVARNLAIQSLQGRFVRMEMRFDYFLLLFMMFQLMPSQFDPREIPRSSVTHDDR